MNDAEDANRGAQIVFRLQPLIRLEDGALYGEEVLAGQDRCPDYALGEWISWYEHFLPQIRKLVRAGSKRLFVNVSTEQLADDRIFEMFQLMPHATHVVLEWTEHRLAGGNDEAVALALERLTFLRRIGFQMAVDDVGHGEDGLGRVLALRPEVVKIDGDLFRALRGRRGGHAFLSGITAALSAIGSVVVVEHIESLDDLAYAKTAGVHCGQGRFFEAS